jgi:hypothetical protein
MTVGAGDLYVAENYPVEGTEGSRIDEFDASTGAFVAQVGHGPYKHTGDLKSGYGLASALDQATGERLLYAGAAERLAESGGSVTYGGAVEVFGRSGGPSVWRGAATPSKGFGVLPGDGVAVDTSSDKLVDWAAGDVYVANPAEETVDVMAPGTSEKYVAQLPGPLAGVGSVAVEPSNGDVLVVVGGGKTIDVFEPTVMGAYALVRQITGTPAGPFKGVVGLTVDGGATVGGELGGEIYVTSEGQGVFQFSSEGVYRGQSVAQGPEGVGSLAVDPETHDMYLDKSYAGEEGRVSEIESFGPTLVTPDVSTGSATEAKPSSATLNGTVDADGAGATSCSFEWGTSASLGNVAACPSRVEGSSVVPVSAGLTGLQPDTAYFYRLQATNQNGANQAETREFTTSGPGIHGEFVSDVASTSTTLGATVAPNGAPTSMYFQYGTSEAYGTNVPAPPGGALGSGGGDAQAAPEHLQGLTPDTVYHYRVVVVSEVQPGVVEVFDGPDHTFTTQPAISAQALPDGREWEMVSPPQKHGASIVPLNRGSALLDGLVQASALGDAISYATSAPTEAQPAGYSNGLQVLSLRGPDGWSSSDIAAPHTVASGATLRRGSEYKFFSNDLSVGALQPIGAFSPSISSEASEQTGFLHTDYLGGGMTDPCVSSCFRPLVTGAPGYANVPQGTTFGNRAGQQPEELNGQRLCRQEMCGPQIAGATGDMEHVVLTSGADLTGDGGGDWGLYEWTAGKLTFIGNGFLGNEGAESNAPNPDNRHPISEDGSRVIYVAPDRKTLLMRDVPRKETLKLNAVQGGSGYRGFKVTSYNQVHFEAASADGSRVFFTSTQRLTANSGASAYGTDDNDLYECEVVEAPASGKLECRLSDLTPRNSFGPGETVGTIAGISEDGSYVYFFADGALAPGAVHGGCRFNGEVDSTEPFDVLCNLYVWHDGVTELVAIISQDDENDFEYTVLAGADGKGLGQLTARVSPDGRWFAFMSSRQLTGYDNRDALTGRPDQEVYLYDAVTKRLVCASCDPTGARPVGAAEGELVDTRPIADGSTFQPAFAADIPGWTTSGHESAEAHYQSRYLSDNGRLFFNAYDALVPWDVNGTWDVYEYEPPGVGGCTTADATHSERSGGCVGLISSGTSAEESAFMDASATGGRNAEGGGDVFFLTGSKLAPQDFDGAPDVYDAHECSEASPCISPPAVPPPPCDTGDSCKSSPLPQPAIFGAPSSATYSGVGNVPLAVGPSVGAKKRTLTRAQKRAAALHACRRKKGRARTVCERTVRSRYAARGSRRTDATGRGR